jgi:hypothetical protein
MLKKDKFKQMFEGVESIKRIVAENAAQSYWEVYDSGKNLLGYAFYLEVPETPPQTEDSAEFDKYEVWGITNLRLEMKALEITPHPEGPEKLWAEGVVEPKYAGQFLGLSSDDIRLSPGGKIDAVTDGTISSKLIVEAIKRQLEFIGAKIKES